MEQAFQLDVPLEVDWEEKIGWKRIKIFLNKKLIIQND
jgi:hypothetical protein